MPTSPPQSDPSEVTLHKEGGATFTGPDAILLYKASMIRMALVMHKRSGMLPNRNFTLSAIVEQAALITKGAYKGTVRARRDEAIQDLGNWIETMKAAMPVNDKRKA